MTLFPLSADRPRFLLGPPGTLEVLVPSLAMLGTLRTRFPSARLAWVIEREWAPLVRQHAALDTLICLPPNWPRTVLGLGALRRALRDAGADATFDPCGTTASAWAVRLSGAPHRIGWMPPRGRGLSPRLNNWLVAAGSASEHTVLSLLSVLGPISGSTRLELPRDAAAQATVDEWIRAAQLLCGFVVIQVDGASPGDSAWARRCGQIARLLGERRRLTAVIVPRESRFEGAVQRAIASSGGHALAAPRWGWAEITALVRRALLFVGAEPGWLQLAAALGTPSLGLCRPSGGDAALLFGNRLVWIDSLVDIRVPPGQDPRESILELPLEWIALICARVLDQPAVPGARVA